MTSFAAWRSARSAGDLTMRQARTRSSPETTSRRDGYLYWMGPELYGAKWRNFKLVLVAQMHMYDLAAKLATPRVINLTTDPQEREPVSLPYLHSWVATHFNRLIGQYQASLQREPLIPMDSSLDHTPTRGDAATGAGPP